jgi:hypothetical protein
VARRVRARLVRGVAQTEASLVDLSRNGALVEAPGDYRPSDAVQLTVDGAAVGSGETRTCVEGRVVRVGQNRVAIEFEPPLAEDWVLRHAVLSAPRRPVAGPGNEGPA